MKSNHLKSVKQLQVGQSYSWPNPAFCASLMGQYVESKNPSKRFEVKLADAGITSRCLKVIRVA